MPKLNFKDAVTELLNHMLKADPVDQEPVMPTLNGAIATDRKPILTAISACEDEVFDDLPVSANAKRLAAGR